MPPPDSQKKIREIHRLGKGTREFPVHQQHCPALDRHKMPVVGVTFASAQYQFIRRNPPWHVVLVTFKGCGEVRAHGKWRRLAPGKAYLCPAGKFHAFHAFHGRGRETWEFGWFIYDRGEKETMEFWRTIIEPRLIGVDPRPLTHILQGLHHEASNGQEPGVMESWVELLHNYAKRMIIGHKSTRLWNLWQNVQANPGLPWTLESLAKKSGLGKENLRRICLQETGKSPMQQVAHLRMRHAISLIAGGQKITAVAEAVGYENNYAFSTAFRRIIGTPPSKFRNKRS